MTNSNKIQNLIQKLMDQRLNEAQISLTSISAGNVNYTFIVDNNYVVKLEKNKNWTTTSDWQEEAYRETEILKLLEESNVNVPKVIEAGEIDGRHFGVMKYSAGENLDKYSRGRNFHKLGRHYKTSISRRLGEALGEIHNSQRFNRFGLIQTGSELKISDSTWSEGISSLQEWWMRKLREYDYDEIANKTEKICDEHSEFLDERNDSSLLHMEFDLRNVLVREDEIVVLDWETAAAGDPLWDLIISEIRIFWLSEENQKYQKAFREGYRRSRSINCDETTEKLYELFQMTRLLVILNGKEDTEERITSRIESLSTQLW